jgi:hypothetical protein
MENIDYSLSKPNKMLESLLTYSNRYMFFEKTTEIGMLQSSQWNDILGLSLEENDYSLKLSLFSTK